MPAGQTQTAGGKCGHGTPNHSAEDGKGRVSAPGAGSVTASTWLGTCVLGSSLSRSVPVRAWKTMRTRSVLGLRILPGKECADAGSAHDADKSARLSAASSSHQFARPGLQHPEVSSPGSRVDLKVEITDETLQSYESHVNV